MFTMEPDQSRNSFRLYSRYAFVGSILLTLAALVTSPALISIGSVLIFVSGIASVPFKGQFRRFTSNRPAFLVALLVVIHGLSLLWTFDTARGLEQLKVKVPLLLILYALAVAKPLNAREIRMCLWTLLASVFFVGSGTVVNYILNYEEINHLITTSKPMLIWLGVSHIYFSVIAAFSVFAGFWLFRKGKQTFFEKEKWLLLVLTLANLLYMHIYIARTGLVALYGTTFVLGSIWVIREKKYKIGLIALALMVSLPVIGYQAVGSFRNRVDNTVWDLSRYFDGKDPNYLSIGTRIEAWKTSVHIAARHPFIGVGMGDLEYEMVDQYEKDQTLLCPENYEMPHNQYLQNLVGYGLLGFLTFMIGFFYPVFARSLPRGFLFRTFWIIFFLAMFVESLLERQVGVVFFALIWMISLQAGLESRPENKTNEA